MARRAETILQFPLARDRLFAETLDLRLKRFTRSGLLRLLPLQLPYLDLGG
ncbi:hypothetical protein QCE73_36475 [Caballeronia sp. LZ029]|uniref:hypothetical protein n=1 Tax=Caballeronia sp. LZ029 TaxID=3038564 RepID=UPI002864B38B|nr:hypothetical protein [Caballeronia sp. LZ029]MDR5748691.1 hypothetical protein [Caballeronia sp. LZ029]